MARALGPRRIGGRYWDGYWGKEYQVLAIAPDTGDWRDWSITVQWADSHYPTTHCTPWDPDRDRSIDPSDDH